MHIEKISDTYHKITFSNGSEVFLVGTAHVSKNSVEEVASIIENENPDRVCIELDASRMASKTSNSWENTDIRKVFKEGKGFLLLANTALASFQRKLGAQTGANPGDEILGAAKLAEEKGIPVSLCDREIQTTFRRAWAKSSLWNKCKLLATLISAAFSDEEISPEELEDLKNQETLEEIIPFLYRKVGMVESELIRRDLISMAQEAEKNGEKLKTRLGDIEAFSRELASERKKSCKEERLYYCLWQTGKCLYIFWGILAGTIFLGELSMIVAGLDPTVKGTSLLFIPVCILFVFLIYFCDIYVPIPFPFKGKAGRILRGLLFVGYLRKH